MTWEPVTPTVEQAVVFTAEATGTEPITYSWDLGDGSWASGPLVLHSYPEAGAYTVALTATNMCGAEVVGQVISVTEVEQRRIYLPLVLKDSP
jgi:PKD repeat protein